MRVGFVARWSKVALISAGVVAIAGLTVGPSYAADDAKVYFVQGLPGDSLDVAVDGKSVAEDVKTAAVVGPFKVKAGSRKVTFSDNGKVVLERMFSVKADSSWDVVVHLPASSSDKPVVTVFKNDLSAVPEGKASLVVAHTAAVPPADIRVNGKVLFANIANGESLKLTVPVATYKVAIVPAGESETGDSRAVEPHRPRRRGESRLRRGRPGEEDDECRGACHRDRLERIGQAVGGQHRNGRPGSR